MNHARRTSAAPSLRRLLALAATTIVAATACGSDDASTPAAATPSTTAAAPAAPATAAASATSAGDDMAAYCAVATELDASDTFPPAGDLMSRYVQVAPAELSTQMVLVTDRLIPVSEDPTAFFVAFADDEVEAALAQVDAFEAEHCGLPADTPPGDGTTTEVEASATRIDVVATDYAFDVPHTASAGRTSFVLSNHGKEAHFVEISKLKPGVTLDEAMSAEDPSTVTEGGWGTGIAAPGGEDEEVVTFDLEPGTYALMCFIPGPGGTPHAFMGMQAEIVVS